MEKLKNRMAPSSWRPLNGTGVRRIPRRKSKNKNKNEDVYKLGTWNVRSLKRPEKIYNVCKEMVRMNIDLMGLSDVRWKNSGSHQIDEHHILYYSGSNESSNKHGVGVIINTKKIKTSVHFIPMSNRSMLIQIQAKPRNINIIQLYAPTKKKDGPDPELDEFYKEAETLLNITKPHEINIMMGDLNAKVGKGEVEGVVGKHGLGIRNDRGDTLVQFCQEKSLVIMNTFFQLPNRRLYTWTSPQHTPDHIVRNQIDFLMINHRFKNCIKSAKTYPGSDINSDHNPVVAVLTCSLKKIKKQDSSKRVDIRKVKTLQTKALVSNDINEWAVEAKQTPVQSVEECWNNLKSKIADINKKHLVPNWIPKQVWMTDRIYQLMEERRRFKNINEESFKNCEKDIRREVRFARHSWYKNKCQYIEKLHAKHDSFNLHKEIKIMIGRKRQPQHQLVDENNMPILDIGHKMRQWERYIASMFADDTRNLCVSSELEDGLPILKDEVANALTKAKTGKATGPDCIHIEILKLIQEEYLDSLVHFMNLVYDTGQLPMDWLKSVFVTIPKKKNAKKCEEFRTISLMSQVLKLFLSVIHERIRTKCDEQLADNQFGFRAGVGTREALFSLQVLVQKCREMQQDVFLCFVDYEKAFDRVKHDRLNTLLRDIGLEGKDLRIIQNLYYNQKATVRVEGEVSNEINIKRGVRQGCILSPTLFNLYSEAIMTEALEDLSCGVKINGRIINNLRYADDTVLIASTEADLQKIVERVNSCSEEAGLTININKTKLMVVSNNCYIDPKIQVASQVLERVQRYKYLGTWLTEDWKSDSEIKTRIEVARSAFQSMRKVLTSRNLNIALRKRILHCYVWPILLYGCESWTIKEELRKRIEAFEMWAYRRMLKISWTQKVTNEEVLRRIGNERDLWKTIKKRKVAYLGHVLRHNRYCLLQLIMMGKVAGKRRIGRKRKSWLRNIREWTGIASAAQLFSLARKRDEYEKLTANLR